MTTPYHLGIYLRSLLPIPALGRQCRPLLSVQTHISKRRNVSRRRFVSYDKMAEAKEFPPRSVRPIVNEVVALLKERHETVSVAETVRILCFLSAFVAAAVFSLTLFRFQGRLVWLLTQEDGGTHWHLHRPAVAYH
jgi:hypothetical protein